MEKARLTAGGERHRGLWRLATSFVRSTRLMAAAGGSPDFVDQCRRAAGRRLHPLGRADDGAHLQFMVFGSNGIKTLLLFIRLRQGVRPVSPRLRKKTPLGTDREMPPRAPSRVRWWRRDCVAGHGGFELRNVVTNYLFERLHRFAGVQPSG